MAILSSRTLRTICLLMLLTAPGILSEAPVHRDSPLTEYPEEDVICKEGHCYPVKFEATNEFQVIREGQTVPKGLHYRINLETGLREAKFIDENEEDDSSARAIHMNVQGDGGRHGEIISVEDGTGDNGVMDQLPEKPQGLDDKELFSWYFSVIMAARPTSLESTIVESLTGMENLVHDMKSADYLADHGALTKLTGMLGESWPVAVQTRAATVLGSAVQNNHQIQEAALKDDLVSLLLTHISHSIGVTSVEPVLLKRLIHRELYALGSLVRGNNQASQALVEGQGLSILLQALRSKPTLSDRIIQLVADLFDPDMRDAPEEEEEDSTAAGAVSSASGPFRLNPQAKEASGWCDIFTRAVIDDNGRVDALRGLRGLLEEVNGRGCDVGELDTWLHQWSPVSGEEDGDEKRLVQQVSNVLLHRF